VKGFGSSDTGVEGPRPVGVEYPPSATHRERRAAVVVRVSAVGLGTDVTLRGNAQGHEARSTYGIAGAGVRV
jgi:hypothetical protein